ncbi:MAG: tetratricopeptide repeat protein [Planctomycetes bacterium]|nr:tetratricopeptide repeat protein [Planctomycetota bacterium]
MDFSKQIQKAEEALRRRNYDFAVELYRQLIDLDPNQGEARGGLRRTLRKRHEQDGGKGGKLLRAMSGALPLSRAKALQKLGKHEACARALEDYLVTNPMDVEANLLLGVSLEQAGHFLSARAVYEFTAEIAPRNPEALKRAGAMMQRTGDHPRALEYYERALEADPRDQEALKARKNLAAESALSKSNSSAVSHSRELIKDKDRSRELERSKRLVLSEEELRADLAKLEERFAGSPSDPELMVQLADVHERLGDPAAALEFVERALSYRKDSFELIAKHGDLESKRLKKAVARADKTGKADEAGALERELVAHEVKDYRRRVEARPGDAQLRLALAKRLLRADDVDGALAELQRCSGEPRVRDEALFHLGQCFQRKGVLDLARKEYEHALQASDGKGERAKEILYNLGTIAEAQGNRDEARSFYVRIYEIDIGYRDVAAKMETPAR